MKRRRPGRPRKGGDRYKSGGLKQPALGPTAEQEIRRQKLAGNNGDPNMTSCPLDILRTREIISSDQHAAGVRYGRLHRLFYGAADARAAALAERIAGDTGPGEPDEVWLSRQRDRLRACEAAMRCISRKAMDDVSNLVAYHRMPSWVFNPGRDNRAVATLRDGLDAVARALGIVEGRRAA